MLFQVTHTHTNKDCPAGSPELTKRFGDWWNGLKTTAGVKVLAGYVSPMDHTFHITVEADDYPTLARALGGHESHGQRAHQPSHRPGPGVPDGRAGRVPVDSATDVPDCSKIRCRR
jgi:hypothetical protein